MAEERVKGLEVFLTRADEALVTRQLKQAFAKIGFIDNDEWDNPSPPIRDAIKDCPSSQIYVWNAELTPKLPWQGKGGGRDPAFIMLNRSKVRNNLLLSGDFQSSFFPGSKTEAWVKAAWRLLKKILSNRLVAVSPYSGEIVNMKVTDFWAGPGAVSWCLRKPDRHLTPGSTENYFRPLTSPG